MLKKGNARGHRAALVSSAALSTVIGSLLICGAPAMAQSSDTNNKSEKAKDDDTTVVVVTGYAASVQKALRNKRAADVISDGIASEDIGKYPEQNIAESLQRVTGVQISRSLGEGQFLSVRGLDPKFTNTLYNGRQLPSASGTRAFDFQVLSSNFANRVDVYKSPTADLIESGLAATVNMQTIDPLTIGKRRLSISAEAGVEEQRSGKVNPHISALYSDVFLGGKLGVSVAIDSNDRAFDSQNFSTDGVLQDSSYTAGTAYRVYGIHQNDLIGTNKRRSATATIQYKPTENLELRLDSIFSDLKQRYNMFQGNNWYVGAGALGFSPTNSVTVDGNGVETAWSGSNVFAWLQANRYEFDQQMQSTALSARYTYGDWDLRGEFSYGRAIERTTQAYISWATRSPGADIYYNTTDDPKGPLTFGFNNGFDPKDPSHYYFFGVQGSYRQPTTDRIANAKFDATRHLDKGYLKAVRFGVNLQDRTLATTPNYMTNSSAGLPSDMSSYLFVYNNPDYFKSYNGGANFPTSFLTVDLDRFLSDFPLAELTKSNPPVQSLTTTTEVQEKSQAAYLRFDFADSADLLRANLGVRVVKTDEYSSGYVPSPGAYLIYGLFGGSNSLSYSDAAVQAQKSSNTYVLPSLNVRYQLGNDILIRFAAARVMQRPDMNLLAAASSPNASSGPPPSSTDTWRGTLVQGNPDLKPFLSDQFDLSFEWYFNRQSMLGAALFSKDVQNLVLTNYSTQAADVHMNGSNEIRQITLSVAQPVNSESTNIKGIEIGYQQAFDYLPGLLKHTGVRANLTHIWFGKVVLNQGSDPLPLTGISKDTYNLGVYYDDGKFSLQAGYNYRGRWVQDPLSFFGDGIFTEGYGQLDLAANYRVNERLSFNAWVVNATESAMRQTNKYGVTRLYALDGRRYSIGARITF
ncbi:TonB-dependent receptor [Asticcacaulis sp. 201]|uniref:TonB-dependent receptor n=1 Tax=Asticcacaulis sp. 201 TaxID=3028787 RepID=UPI0029165315|nr:TonB-dependent receptor [Asticcacaulis sp. 201]MDV6330695.1 TonB-dependent receptor [Asticcacaulis sp. 201]